MYINNTNPNDPKRSKYKCHRWLPDLPLQKCDVPWLLLNIRYLIQSIHRSAYHPEQQKQHSEASSPGCPVGQISLQTCVTARAVAARLSLCFSPGLLRRCPEREQPIQARCPKRGRSPVHFGRPV